MSHRSIPETVPTTSFRRLAAGFATVLVAVLVPIAGCGGGASEAPPSVDAFLEDAETRLMDSWIRGGRAQWVQQNFITVDTEKIAAAALEETLALNAELAAASTHYAGDELAPEAERKLRLLKTNLAMAAPSDPALQKELAEIATTLESDYGRGEYCEDPGDPESCLDLGELSAILAAGGDPDAMLEAWTGWRTVSPPMRERYARFVELTNAGANELGFDDMGALWRSNYDMDPDAFAAEMDRLWGQVAPLYEALHCHVRAQLAKRYGEDVVPLDRPIPAHLLGNMWAQSWGNVFDLVMPAQFRGGGVDVTKLLRDGGIDEIEMVRIAERFFTSLGLRELPETFWDRSLFLKPEDRDVVCHASAWNLDFQEDVRIKMCIKVDGEDFVTVHHELGHNYYQMAYNVQPALFQESANDGFHEGLGDTLALSITPSYLVQIGLLDREPQHAGDLEQLMRLALDKVAFLPFGLLVDRWRWAAFSGEADIDGFNDKWWELRTKYQGIEAPVARSADAFDPGAKYHVPANTPYSRYFLAHILQFQFHQALCEAAGFDGPLHRCSIYGSEEAGAKLQAMMEMGASRPWPDALEAVTGGRELDATPLLAYFAPLAEWLETQNEGRTCGW